MNKIERILRILNREEVDYLPSQITLGEGWHRVRITQSLIKRGGNVYD